MFRSLLGLMNMSRPLLVLMLALGSMSLVVGVGAALFTSYASVDRTFTAGTVIITADPATEFITLTNMAPGDSLTAPITVTNAGSLQMRYAITDTVTDDGLGLGHEITMAVKYGGTCTLDGFGTDGTPLYAGPLGTYPDSMKVVGDPKAIGDAGNRTLNSLAHETLCFQVVLPITATNSYQGAKTTATFDFIAEQTANNSP